MKSRERTGFYVAILTLAGLGVLGFGGTTARAREASPKGTANRDLLARAQALLKRAKEAGGNYTSAGGDYYFDGYLRDPVTLLALRHDIAEMVEARVRAASAKAQ
jgi:hypothetical protein